MSGYGYESYGYAGAGSSGAYSDGYSVYTAPFLDAYGSASVGHPSYATDTTASGLHRTSYFYESYDGGYYRHDTNRASGYYAQTTRYASGYGDDDTTSSNTSYYHSYGANGYYSSDTNIGSYYRDTSNYSIDRDGGRISYFSATAFVSYQDGSSYFIKEYSANDLSPSGFESHGYDVTARTDSYGYTTYAEHTF